MKVIGITGGVGCGKSMVMDFLESEYNALVLKADSVGHLLMEPGMPCYVRMVEHFGKRILNPDDTINRKEVAAIVFADEKELAVQSAIMHPEIKTYILQKIKEAKYVEKKYCFVEAALFFEDHYDDFCDEVWYIYADEDIRRDRLMKSRGYSLQKIKEIMDQQMTEEEFYKRTDFTVNNSKDPEDTKKQIKERMLTL